MPIKKFIEPLEAVLLFSTWILLIVVNFTAAEKGLPYSYEILGGLSIFCTLLFASPILRKKTVNLSWIQTAAVSVIAFAAVQLSKENITVENLHFPALYFIVAVSNSIMGKNFAGISSFIILAAGETASFCLNACISNLDLQSIIMDSDNYYPLIYLFISSFFPSILSRPSHSANTKRQKTFVSPEVSTIKSNTVFLQLNTDTQSKTPVTTQNTSLNFSLNYIKDIDNQNADNVQNLLYSIVYFMSRNFKAHSSLGFIFNPVTRSFDLNSFQSKSVYILKGISIPLGKGIIGKIGLEKRAFMSGNLPLYNSEILYYSSPLEINSLLAAPIISDTDELLGALVLDSIDKNAFKDQDMEILKRFSILAAALITNARMRAFQERTAHTFQIFYHASHRFTTSLDLNNVFEVLFTTVPMITPCSRQIGIVFDENRNVGRIVGINGNSLDIKPGMEFPINQGLYSFVFQKRKMVNINDYLPYLHKYYRFFPNEKKDQSIRSLIIFPITDDEFRCRGVFSVESNEPNQFTNETIQIFSTLMENASVAFTRAVLYQKMELLATTDGLTGLNNHRHFQEILAKELERAKRYKHHLSLLLMDIDHFKTFNDTYGHPVGDLVLKEISLCIQKSIRTNDIPARYGGEEFTVIIPETNQANALIIAERIRVTIEKHVIQSLEKKLHVTVSIGCATYPSQAASQQELIDLADKALYYSKEHGRNQVNVYQPIMTDNGKMHKN
jgi:diguanylate cyclase (GGDEF)-like protein